MDNSNYTWKQVMIYNEVLKPILKENHSYPSKCRYVDIF